jgi:hypothetical protein
MAAGTHPIDDELAVFEQVKKFPGLSPASNVMVGAASAMPAVPHPITILNRANKSCRMFIKAFLCGLVLCEQQLFTQDLRFHEFYFLWT